MRDDDDPDSFGEGNERGVISAEAANSATVAGSLIPTLSFGIPGSGTTAVLPRCAVDARIPARSDPVHPGSGNDLQFFSSRFSSVTSLSRCSVSR